MRTTCVRGIPGVCDAKVVGGVVHYAAVLQIARGRLFLGRRRRPYRVQPADQRARAVPGEYLRSAIECDRTWNGTLPRSVGTFEAYMRSLPPVIGLSFGGYGEWSKEVDTLIGQLAEIASEVPERLGCCHGPTHARGQYSD